jgi:hypothetical protein
MGAHYRQLLRWGRRGHELLRLGLAVVRAGARRRRRGGCGEGALP